MQDVRQSVYDIPHRQSPNTSGGQQSLAEAAAHWSTSQAQHQRAQASAALHSQAVNAEAAATEAAQSLAGMDVRQSMYSSSQDISALDDTWVSLHRSHQGDCQILTLHSEDTQQPHAAPVDQSLSHASRYSWAEPDWAGDNSQQPQSLDAHPSRRFGAMPNRPSSDAQLDQQGYWQEQPEQEMLPRIPSASLSLSLDGRHSQWQQVHSPADHAQHAQRAQHEQLCKQQELQHGQREQRCGQRELQHGQHDPEDVQHDKCTSANIHHEARQRFRADEYSPQSMYEQSAHAGQGNGSTRDVNRQYADRASHSAAAPAGQPEVTVAYGKASTAAALVSNQARHASTAPCQASMPVNGQSGWDLDELDVTGTASQPHSHDTCQPSRHESSSLGSEQEAALWDLVNEEPYQIGLTVQQQQHGNSFSQQRSSTQHAQHSAFDSSQQSSHQASRISSSRPSSADSSSQAHQQYRHRSERVPASQMQPGELQCAEHWPHSGKKHRLIL